MLEGQTVVFLSCMDAFADQLARPIRGQLNELGYRAIIVTDEPLLRGSFDPESKVSAYIEASDAFVALCTQDDRVPGSTAQNIIDEIGRARSHPSLREVVCVLKEANVKLPSNINPVWNALEADKPDAAFGVIRRQLEAWGVVPTVPRSVPTGTARLPTGFLDDLFEGVGLGDHDKAEAKLRVLFGRTTKSDQGRVVEGIFDYAMTLPENGADIHIVTSFLEAAARARSRPGRHGLDRAANDVWDHSTSNERRHDALGPRRDSARDRPAGPCCQARQACDGGLVRLRPCPWSYQAARSHEEECPRHHS